MREAIGSILDKSVRDKCFPTKICTAGYKPHSPTCRSDFSRKKSPCAVFNELEQETHAQAFSGRENYFAYISAVADRYGALKYIQTFDPERDAHQIVAVSSAFDFAQDMEISLGLAFFRTFAIPSIARILDETKQFEKFGQKRYDDTTILLAEFLENGLDSERGREAIRRMN